MEAARISATIRKSPSSYSSLFSTPKSPRDLRFSFSRMTLPRTTLGPPRLWIFLNYLLPFLPSFLTFLLSSFSTIRMSRCPPLRFYFRQPFCSLTSPRSDTFVLFSHKSFFLPQRLLLLKTIHDGPPYCPFLCCRLITCKFLYSIRNFTFSLFPIILLSIS